MAVIEPAGVPAQGRVKVVFTPTIAAPATGPTVAEVNAAGGLDLSGFLYPDGWTPGAETNRGTAPRRLNSTVVRERIGATTERLGDLRYMIDPQAAGGSDAKKAFEKLVPDDDGWIIERLGLDVDTAPAAGQFVNLIEVQFGVQKISGDTTDEFAEFSVVQAVGVLRTFDMKVIQA